MVLEYYWGKNDEEMAVSLREKIAKIFTKIDQKNPYTLIHSAL